MECIEFDEADILRQGDVFRWTRPAPPWQSFGIVITGDCDLLTKQKPFLNYVPLLRLSEYIPLFLATKEVQKACDSWQKDLYARIETLRKRYRPDTSELSLEAVQNELIGRRNAQEILDILGVSSKDDANRFLIKAEAQIPLIPSP
jgi:hypothetical protein